MSEAATRAVLIPNWTFGDRIRRIRRMLKLSQAEFSVPLGITPQAVGAWESDRTRPNDVVEMAQRIEESYGVPATWTLGLDGRARRDSNPQPSDP